MKMDHENNSQFSLLHSPVPKGYKQTEVGVIPEDWAVVSMAELFTFQNGVNADKAAYGKGLPFINVLEVITHSTLTEKEIPGRILLPPQTSSTFRVRRSDVLFNRTSETQEEVGLASVYIDDREVVFGGFVIRAKPRGNNLEPIFSSYVLRSPAIRQQIIARGQGVVRANIGQQDLSKVLIFFPPFPEQEAIAEALSDADALIESLTQLIAKKRQIKQGAMQELLTGKRRLHGFANATIGYKQTEVGVIPEDWKTATLGNLTILMTNGFVGTATRHYASNDNGVLYIQGYNVEENSFNFHGIKFVTEEFHKVHMKSCLRSGDLLTVQTGDVGLTTVITNQLAGSNCHALIISRFDRKAACPHFISYYLNSKVGRSRMRLIETGTTMKHLNVGDMLEFLVPAPHLPEQDAIAEVLSEMDTEITTLETKLAKAREIKQGMMHNLLTGRIRLV